MHHHQHDARSDDAGEAAAIGTALPGAVVHEDHAHDRHAGYSAAMFRRKFWVSFALTIPILIWGHMLAELIGYSPPALPGAMWIAPIFGTAVFAYGGWPFVTGAIGELRDGLPGMMTLIALAIGVAFVFSVAVTFGYPGMPLWGGARDTRDRHAPRSLARNELRLAGAGRAFAISARLAAVDPAVGQRPGRSRAISGKFRVRRIYEEGRCAIGKLHPAFIGVKNVPPWPIMKCDGDGESRLFTGGARMA